MDIFEAARSGNIKTLARLIKGGKKIIDQQDKHGVTPLMHAAFYGRPDVIRILLQANACVDLKSYKGYDALGLALGNNRKPVIAVFKELLPDYASARETEWLNGSLTNLTNLTNLKYPENEQQNSLTNKPANP